MPTPRMPLAGFDPQFRDLPDYIEKITREIWEDRAVGAGIERYYTPDVIVRAPGSITTGSAAVTAATLGTLHEFPDRQLIYEDVIWSGSADTGYYSSHRLISVMRKRGAGAFGPASGALVRARVIADCVCSADRISEEWLVRDISSFAACLGTTAEALARDSLAADIARTGAVHVFTPAIDIAGPYGAHIDTGRDGQRHADAWSAIWADKNLAAIRSNYATGATIFVPGGEALSGHDDFDQFVVSYLAAFPDAAFSVDHLIVNDDPGQALRIAMRWSLTATHSGWGRFGAPTGAPVYILGISHAHVVNGRIAMEWIQIDEVAIWKQVLGYAAR